MWLYTYFNDGELYDVDDDYDNNNNDGETQGFAVIYHNNIIEVFVYKIYNNIYAKRLSTRSAVLKRGQYCIIIIVCPKAERLYFDIITIIVIPIL